MSRRDGRKPPVFVTLSKQMIVEYSPEGLATLRAYADVRFNPYDRRITSSEISKEIVDCDAILLGTQLFGPEQMDAAPRLRVISRFGVGYDNVDVAAATKRRIWVTTTGTANSDSVADLAMGLILSVARRLTIADQEVRRGGGSRIGGLLGWVSMGRPLAWWGSAGSGGGLPGGQGASG